MRISVFQNAKSQNVTESVWHMRNPKKKMLGKNDSSPISSISKDNYSCNYLLARRLLACVDLCSPRPGAFLKLRITLVIQSAILTLWHCCSTWRLHSLEIDHVFVFWQLQRLNCGFFSAHIRLVHTIAKT